MATYKLFDNGGNPPYGASVEITAESADFTSPEAVATFASGVVALLGATTNQDAGASYVMTRTDQVITQLYP